MLTHLYLKITVRINEGLQCNIGLNNKHYKKYLTTRNKYYIHKSKQRKKQDAAYGY